MDTILLDRETWDLVLTSSGNIALASDLAKDRPLSRRFISNNSVIDAVAAEAYGQAQDAASQIRLFRGELIFDVTQGVPYWQTILGYLPNTQLMIAKFTAAALLVPGVTKAKVEIVSTANRQVQGTVFITNLVGSAASIGF